MKSPSETSGNYPRPLPQSGASGQLGLRNGAVPHWALAPHPMSPAEVADLIERTRRACVEAQQRSQQAGTAGYQARTRGPAAVRFVTECGWSVEDAAKHLGLSTSHVRSLVRNR